MNGWVDSHKPAARTRTHLALAWLMWGVVGTIMAGRILRGAVARAVIGPLYLAVGSALVISSRLTWRAWHERGP